MGCDGAGGRRVRRPRDFNPRIPYGMRPITVGRPATSNLISIHASRMGCDASRLRAVLCIVYFNPRIPYGMRRFKPYTLRLSSNFNPRIPYGMRRPVRRLGDLPDDFNPRIPYGMRPSLDFADPKDRRFQSTHPVWDATPPRCEISALPRFQSTHPVWDATARMDIAFHNMEIFARSSS